MKAIFLNKRNRVQYYCFIFLFFLLACEENEPVSEINENKYLLEFEQISSIDANQLRGVAQIFQPSFDVSAIQYNSDIYKITYQSEYRGEDVVTSGLVCIPAAAKTTDFPLLLGFHPSISSQDEAPSSFSDNLQSGVELFGALGFITVIPDYIGFGSSSSLPHPFLVREAMSKNSVDMLLAVEELLAELEQIYRKEVSMIGYSQGGYNAVATLRHFENEQPLEEWQVVATAAGGGTYDLDEMKQQIFQQQRYDAPQNIAFLIYSYHEYYDFDGSFDQYFQEAYTDFIPTAFGNDLTLGQIKGRLTSDLEQLLEPSFLNELRTNSETDFNDALSENSIIPWQVQSPLHIYHATKDSVINIENSRSFYKEIEAMGSQQLNYTELTEPSTHTNAGAPMLLDGILWILENQNL
ncbi:pimeloyl-ACP methyl ester carboxylesterase [Catalinimonas alkaloidigena]|uniref:alpha/beta hydrolase family protein n=1 Tax=Catalinimonas alkaloidigena TaxID=1075417 RepID=UPI002405E840|nr:alpha/beta hydrolase [Catalinimonas alkaloidigena]MDF9797345.1 pimeloyl-ACP methyl ester carboxylesterase [Catalinimonas alkaloidigena]